MASASWNPLLNLPSLRARGGRRIFCAVHVTKRATTPSHIQPGDLHGRRQCLLLLTGWTAVSVATKTPALAEDIPLFGIRKKLRKAEKETEEILREGEMAVEEGLVAAEKGIQTAKKEIESAEKEIEAAEKEIETSVSFGGVAQAVAVAGTEILGVLVASSVVNQILGPEAQES
ncbi:uncharacterized protein [Aristolochia californica]|uniref:uncharacterized protein n=1 Tax=Aristolochia californica TaxID=171875 RepID=UPI0035D79225